jgi:hypothetical protein
MVVGRKEETLGVSIRMSNAIYQSISLLRTGDEACSDGEKGIPQHLEATRAAPEKRGHMMPLDPFCNPLAAVKIIYMYVSLNGVKAKHRHTSCQSDYRRLQNNWIPAVTPVEVD